MKIYCSCCDKVQPVRVDDCLDAKTNEPFQDIVCNECDLVIASGTGITKHPSLEEAVGAAYKTGWEHGKAVEREACAKVCEAEANRAEWNWDNDISGNQPFWNGGEQLASSCAAAIRARGQA